MWLGFNKILFTKTSHEQYFAHSLIKSTLKLLPSFQMPPFELAQGYLEDCSSAESASINVLHTLKIRLRKKRWNPLILLWNNVAKRKQQSGSYAKRKSIKWNARKWIVEGMSAKKMLKRFLERQGSLGRWTCSKHAFTSLLQEKTLLWGSAPACLIYSTYGLCRQQALYLKSTEFSAQAIENDVLS